MNKYFDQLSKLTKYYREAYNFLKGEVSAYLNQTETNINSLPIPLKSMAKLLDLFGSGLINNKTTREFFNEMISKNADPEKLYEASKKAALSDDDITKIVNTVLDENAQGIEDFKNGKDRAFGFLIGQIMKKSQGKADPKRSNEILKIELDKR